MRRLLCSSIADLAMLLLSMMCLFALSSCLRSSKAASSGCCFARSQSSKTPSCLVLLQSVKEQSRGRAARRLRDAIQAPSTRASRSHMSGRGPRRDRAAGREGHDIHTMINNSLKRRTHSLCVVARAATVPEDRRRVAPRATPYSTRSTPGGVTTSCALPAHGQESAESALCSCFAASPRHQSHPTAHRNPQRITFIHGSRQQPACTVYKTTKQLARSTRPEIDCSHSHYKLVPLP